MRLIILNEIFYSEYSRQQYPEILEKTDRPYYCLSVEVDDQTFAIPLRHPINHPFAFFTVGKAGIDYTKAIVLKEEYISQDTPWIDSKEWRLLRSHEKDIFYGFRRYLRQFKRAMKHPENPRSRIFLQYSSLKYFELE